MNLSQSNNVSTSEGIEYLEALDRLLFESHEISPTGGKTALVKRWQDPNTAVVVRGRRGKDDRKQKTLAPVALQSTYVKLS